MSRLRVHSIAISIYGFGAGPDQTLNNPLGVGGVALYEWVFTSRTFQGHAKRRRRQRDRASMTTLRRAASMAAGHPGMDPRPQHVRHIDLRLLGVVLRRSGQANTQLSR